MCKRVWNNLRPSFSKLYNMGNRISKFKTFVEDITTLSSSRWGIFTALLAFSALLIAIGSWTNMNWLIHVGFGLIAAAVVLAIIWLIRGSRDTTATKKDINRLGKKIDRLGKKIETPLNKLANEIKLERESRERESKNTTKKTKD